MASKSEQRFRSMQIFGGAKDFCPNFHKFARKIIQRKLKKNQLHFFSCWPYFFQIKALQAPFLPKYFQTCPNFP